MKALLIIALAAASAETAVAGTIIVSGVITQSVSDGTGPALANPGLNSIQTLDPYSLELSFSGLLSGPGTSTLTGTKFEVTSRKATEKAFTTALMTITASGLNYDFSVFACLAKANCGAGNQLNASFRIPAKLMAAQKVPATGLDLPRSLNLLEDDGLTDIQGSITLYSAIQQSPVPEPSTTLPLAGGLALAAGLLLRSRNRK